MIYTVYPPNLHNANRKRFFGHLRVTEHLSINHLACIVRSSDQYSPLMRSAALRQIVGKAPIEVTLGRSYAESRRLCRKFYQI